MPQPTPIKLCPAQHLGEGQSRGFRLDELNLLAVRRRGQVYLYENRCPHRGVPLEWQPDQFLDASGSLLQCATHGALFLIDSGECVAGPCAGQSLRALPCKEDAQGIWLLRQFSEPG
jgi:nitrite reductase/ring-hydroxylating ferredoxin subunit